MNPPIPSDIGRRRSSGAGFPLLLFAFIVWLVANQIVAQRMGYVSDLGRSFPLHLGPLHRFYWPFGIIEWSLRFNGFLGRVYPPHVVATANASIVTGLEWGAGVAAAIIVPRLLWKALHPPKDAARGMVDSSGNWATEADVERVGLFADSGFILGGFPTLRGLRTIRYSKDAGMTGTGPPGSRKTSSWLANNLTSLLADPDSDNWPEEKQRSEPFGREPSHIVLDVRGYLVRITSGWRRAIGHKVFIFEPFSTNKALTKINTLWSIHVGGLKMYDHCYRAAQDAIGETDGLVTSTGANGSSTYWDQACTAFKAAIIGTMAFRSLYERNPKLLSYHECVKYIDSFRSIEKLLIDMEYCAHDPHGVFAKQHPDLFDADGRCLWIVDCTQAMANKEAEERALDEDTKVLTPTGYRLMRELQVGDFVIGKNGEPTRITGVYPQGMKEAYRVMFDDDVQAICCDDHLWEVHNPNSLNQGKGKPMVWPFWKIRQRLDGLTPRHEYAQRRESAIAMRAQGMMYKDLGAALGFKTEAASRACSICRTTGHAGYAAKGSMHRTMFIPTVEPIKFDHVDLPLDPYILGVLLGDGHLRGNQASFTSADHDIVEAVREPLPTGTTGYIKQPPTSGEQRNATNGRFVKGHSNGMRPAPNAVGLALQGLGIAGKGTADKSIPEIYKFAHLEARVALLQGLFDTDGSPTNRACRAEYLSISKQLADDVMWLIRSVGGYASCLVRDPEPGEFLRIHGTTKVARTYRVHGTFPKGIIPFLLPRKVALFSQIRRNRVPMRAFKSAEPIGKRRMICIKVEAADGLFAIEHGVVTHNSGVYGTMIEKLNLFRSPVIGMHTCESTVDFKRLVNSSTPGCLYLSIPGMELTHAAPLLRVIVSHALRDVTEDGTEVRGGQEVRGNERPLAVWLDEIAAAKTIPALTSSAGFLRGHGVYLCTFWQSVSQLHRWYGHDETLSETFQVHAFQTPNTHKAAKFWSDALGQFSKSITRHSTSFNNGYASGSQGADVHTRQLLTPGEVLKLPRDKTVLLAFGEKILATTTTYWMNPSVLLRTLYPYVRRPDVDVPEPQYHERIASLLGRDELEALQQPLPEPEPIPEPPYKISLLEQHILDEHGDKCACPAHQPKEKEAAPC